MDNCKLISPRHDHASCSSGNGHTPLPTRGSMVCSFTGGGVVAIAEAKISSFLLMVIKIPRVQDYGWSSSLE